MVTPQSSQTFSQKSREEKHDNLIILFILIKNELYKDLTENYISVICAWTKI